MKNVFSTSQKSIWDHSFSKIRHLVFIRLAQKVVWGQPLEEPRARSRRPSAAQDVQGSRAQGLQGGGQESKECLQGSRGTEEFFHTTILAQAVCDEQCSVAGAQPSLPALVFVTKQRDRTRKSSVRLGYLNPKWKSELSHLLPSFGTSFGLSENIYVSWSWAFFSFSQGTLRHWGQCVVTYNYWGAPRAFPMGLSLPKPAEAAREECIWQRRGSEETGALMIFRPEMRGKEQEMSMTLQGLQTLCSRWVLSPSHILS